MAGGLPNRPTDAFANCTFGVEIDGVTIALFQELSGITSELDVIELKQNTKDGKYVIHKMAGNRKPPTITLKRGKDSSMDIWEWHKKVVDGKLSDARKNGSVVLYDYDHSEVGRYNFMNAWPSKVSMSSLKSGANEVLMEETTLVCEELERVK